MADTAAQPGRGRGRPALPEDARRTERLNLPLEEPELAWVSVRAARMDERPTTYAARVVLERLERFRLLDVPEATALERLREVADGLNREVHRLHTDEARGDVVDVRAGDAVELQRLLDALAETVRRARPGSAP